MVRKLLIALSVIACAALGGSAAALAWGARWGRFAKVTSIHRIDGEYVGFVCYDRPGKIH